MHSIKGLIFRRYNSEPMDLGQYYFVLLVFVFVKENGVHVLLVADSGIFSKCLL